MPDIRRKADVMLKLNSLNKNEHQSLKVKGASDNKIWDNATGEEGKLVDKFRRDVKGHYLRSQRRLCCYCSRELADDHSTFDAEHILDKNTHPQFMFDLTNISASCRPCNRAKNDKAVVRDGVDTSLQIPTISASYKIVHPHLDEWGQYLEFDQFNRIKAKHGEEKGTATIDVCGIARVNAARLADRFLPMTDGKAEKAIEGYYRVTNKTWKRKYAAMLRSMADQFDLPQAKAIVEMMEIEIGMRAAVQT